MRKARAKLEALRLSRPPTFGISFSQAQTTEFCATPFADLQCRQQSIPKRSSKSRVSSHCTAHTGGSASTSHSQKLRASPACAAVRVRVYLLYLVWSQTAITILTGKPRRRVRPINAFHMHFPNQNIIAQMVSNASSRFDILPTFPSCRGCLEIESVSVLAPISRLGA